MSEINQKLEDYIKEELIPLLPKFFTCKILSSKIFQLKNVNKKFMIFFDEKMYFNKMKVYSTEIDNIGVFRGTKNEYLLNSSNLKLEFLKEFLSKDYENFIRKKNSVNWEKLLEIREKYLKKKIEIEKEKKNLKYINKDYDRFRNKKYTTEIYDRNKGSWDIFEATDENNDGVIDGEKINEDILDRKIYGRNPKNDIVKSGVIGIDFGTKSTVVVSYKDDNEGIDGSKTLPIRISGNLDAIERTENYENATIIHFDNIEKFITEYLSSEGRPYTHYDDIQVSVDAENELKRTQNNFDINEFMLDLKQWSANKNKKKTIADKTGKEIILNGYLELNENEFDPIEIYAYYIGCRINNMAQYSIFLEYILSFPVTYELEVKNKILNSFRKGIMKSLPNSILNDEEIMKNFRGKCGASEPDSYAITALKKFCV